MFNACLRLLILIPAATAVGCGSHQATASTGASPVKVGNGYICPTGDPVLAFGHFYYPSTYPKPPAASLRPDGCFASSAQSELAGYRQAPTPPNDLRIHGVYLAPAGRSVLTLCQSAAGVARLTLRCPALLPAGSSLSCVESEPCAQPGWFVVEGSFLGPAGYAGVPGDGGHLLIIGYSRHVHGWPRDTLTGGRQVGTARVDGHRAVIRSYRPGTGLNSGHIALSWSVCATTYVVSLHGATRTNRRLDEAIAHHLRVAGR